MRISDLSSDWCSSDLAETRGVYLFDELDASGGKRGADNDVGEARRILNSFLQFLEEDRSESLIVATTNHPEILDRALFRRFHLILEYSLPEPDLIVKTVRSEERRVGKEWVSYC